MSISGVSEAPAHPRWHRPDGYVLDSDPAAIDRPTVFAMLQATYWAAERTAESMDLAIANSINFVLTGPEGTVGFCRVVSDGVVVAWLSDVIVDERLRGRGLGQWMVGCALAHPRLADVRQWLLATRDAHGLYRRFGFAEPPPGRFMQYLPKVARAPKGGDDAGGR